MNPARLLFSVLVSATALTPVDAAEATSDGGHGACLAAGDPAAQTVRAELLARERSAIDGELAHRQLRRLSLQARYGVAHRGAMRQPGDTEPQPPSRDSYVRGDSYWTGGGRAPEPWEFVTDARGNVWRLAAEGRPSGTRTIQYCGCQPLRCEYGSGCPGCFDTMQVWYGPLPKGSRYRGPLVIHFPAELLEESWERGQCPGECPPPPPSAAPPPPPARSEPPEPSKPRRPR